MGLYIHENGFCDLTREPVANNESLAGCQAAQRRDAREHAWATNIPRCFCKWLRERGLWKTTQSWRRSLSGGLPWKRPSPHYGCIDPHWNNVFLHRSIGNCAASWLDIAFRRATDSSCRLTTIDGRNPYDHNLLRYATVASPGEGLPVARERRSTSREDRCNMFYHKDNGRFLRRVRSEVEKNDGKWASKRLLTAKIASGNRRFPA